MWLVLCLHAAWGHATDAPSTRPVETFVVGHWSFPKDEARQKQFAQAGFNTVIATPEELPACRKYGWRALLAVPADKAPEFKNDPIVWAYFLMDEPARKKLPYETLVPQMEAFHRLDRSRPAYINLNELDDPQSFIKLLKPRVLSYDYYQWWDKTEPFFPLLEKYRSAALDAKIPLLFWAEAVTVPHGPPPADNEARVRHSVYSALAYGVKGIQWWAWRADSPDCAKINAELKMLGPELVKLQSVDVFHTAPLPTDTRAIPAECWVQSPTEQLVLGLFKDGEGHDYILAANKNWRKPQTATLTFVTSVKSVSKLDRATGKWVELGLKHRGARSEVTQDLAPGDGMLLRVEKQQ